ncbi:MAG: TetR/AcrR family transcriptional regulator [Nitrospirae bacterium]|nr:TetR/AcrR family transcriptional regulator [Nitrospirota bacterium]
MGRNAEQNKEMRARTRSKILDAAREVFGDKGFDASRIEDIAQVAQVAKGLFYEHFKNKEDIVRQFALQVGNEIFQNISSVLESQSFADPRSVFRSAIEAYFSTIDRNRNLALFFAREGRSVSVGLGRVIHLMFDRLESLAYGQFERGLREGLLRPALHYGLIARALTGLLEQAGHYYLTHPDLTREQAIQSLVEFSVGGVAQTNGAHA